jgi:hypothetical protein
MNLVSLILAAALATGAAPRTNAGGDVMFHKVKASRILFLGNSITLHGPAPAIGWEGNWGMAASARDKDYVHLVVKAIAGAAGKEPETLVANIARFERQFETYDFDAELGKELAFQPDLVIVAVGDNVPALASDQARSGFRASLTRLLKKLKANSRPTIVVKTCFWADPVKDAILDQACKDVGGVLVDWSTHGKVEANLARSERAFSNGAVGGHPGDRGMQVIADSILEALRKVGP